MHKKKVNFGFREVESDKKSSLVGEVFKNVASRYDIMNDLMSLGMHRLWKQYFVNLYKPHEGCRILDVAGGTGDIAFRFHEIMRAKDIDGEITITDINPAMLEEGKKRTIDRGILDKIKWQEADGENLPFKDNSFDCYTVAFGIRNFTNIEKGLAEAYRVLKPGGKFMCMEFTPVDAPGIKEIYDAYSFNIIPWVGDKVTGNREAYQYLVESIRKFPDKKTFAAMIKECGFQEVKIRTLAAGVVAIHTAWKI